MNGQLELRVPRGRLTITADTPEQRPRLGLLNDERHGGQRQAKRGSQHLVVHGRIGEVAVADRLQQSPEPVIVRTGLGPDRRRAFLVVSLASPTASGRRQTTLTFCASSPLRPGATSNSTRCPSFSVL